MMTEKDLYKYRDAKRAEERARLKLIEFEAQFGSSRAAMGSPTPPDHSGDPTNRIVADVERHNVLLQKVELAVREVSLAEMRLEAARQYLHRETDIEVFDALYFGWLEGKRLIFPNVIQIGHKLSYATSTVYAARKRILDTLVPVAV
jgi:hypothetical protein